MTKKNFKFIERTLLSDPIKLPCEWPLTVTELSNYSIKICLLSSTLKIPTNKKTSEMQTSTNFLLQRVTKCNFIDDINRKLIFQTVQSTESHRVHNVLTDLFDCIESNLLFPFVLLNLIRC